MLDAILNLLVAVWDVLAKLGVALTPWLPLIAWCVFWLFGVNWRKLHVTLARGGWIPVILIGLVAVLVWGLIAPPTGDVNDFGWPVSNFVGKTVYVAGLLCIMLVCGAVQGTGCCDRWCCFAEETDADTDDGGH